jgi:mRNA interferase MazF
MITEGQIVLFRFPQTDQNNGKLRDIVINQGDSDFIQSGLKLPSLIRISRLAVASEEIFTGKLGQIDTNRLKSIKERLASWILQT